MGEITGDIEEDRLGSEVVSFQEIGDVVYEYLSRF